MAQSRGPRERPESPRGPSAARARRNWPCARRVLSLGRAPRFTRLRRADDDAHARRGGVPGVRAEARCQRAERARRDPIGPAALRFGRSIGSPTEGHLLGGRTPRGDRVPAHRARRHGGRHPLGTRAARHVARSRRRAVRRQFPGVVMSVGHLSREGGGDVDQHRSHESGRDADVGFFVRSAAGRQLLSPHFVPFRADGTAPTLAGRLLRRREELGARLRVRRRSRGARDAPVRRCAASGTSARIRRARPARPQSARMRAAELMQQPHGVLPHDDHFHVRIGCPAHMSGCVENPTARVAHTSASAAQPPRRASSTRS